MLKNDKKTYIAILSHYTSLPVQILNQVLFLPSPPPPPSERPPIRQGGPNIV
jgi:hypothetical protein